MNGIHILIIEDDKTAAKYLARAIEREGYTVNVAHNAVDGMNFAHENEPHIVLLDLNLPDRFGIDLLREIKGEYPNAEVIINTGISDVDTAVEAMRAGAFDYIVKPLNIEAITLTLKRVVETRNLKKENRFLREQYESLFSLQNVGIHSPVLAQVFEDGSRYSPRELPVLIQGESGTGKELVARHIHALSSGNNGHAAPFIPINCGALPTTLAESELFGYAPGAFTGAERKGKIGKITAADGGTVFLDEVGELPPETQAKLLRFLQEKTFFPVGSNREKKVNVKVICATNRNLAEEVANGNFRKDLFFRINVGSINVPPLRERASEIIPLARQFLSEFSQAYKRQSFTINRDAQDILVHHDWPGNVRELRNLCERIVLVEEGPELTDEHLRDLGLNAETIRKIEGQKQGTPSPLEQEDEAKPQASKPAPAPAAEGIYLPESGLVLEDYINKVVEAAYEKNGFNQSRTARYLGITREVLRHRLKKMGFIEKK
ncbi:MAG: sigma-54-dependent Fis family transcriptional regulator [Planctomycetes bacterium]|nr:sigma-54-dependent Fis family transcriptional regulator [Planctomycetota bacterium]